MMLQISAKQEWEQISDFSPEQFPKLYNLSAAFIYQFIPRPLEKRNPEYVYIQTEAGIPNTPSIDRAISEWNFAWEAGHLRYDLFADKLPPPFNWLQKFEGHNLYLIPKNSFHRYYAYSPLFHLLPKRTLERFGLPLIKQGVWPYISPNRFIEDQLPKDFDTRLAEAFAYHIWGFLNSRSPMSAFDSFDSIRVLAHNLDFWLPYVQMVVEERLRTFDRVTLENDEQANLLTKLRVELPPQVEISRPLMGGVIWMGEDEGWEATQEVVERADAKGKLRSIIDAIQSNRIEDDFSQQWSYEKEDFERKLYNKRSKFRVNFVELTDTIPVHGPDSEVHENLLWEDFIALLNEKEKRIVVCIRNGETKVGEISKLLGYANHSPVSKALARIRKKALTYLVS